MSLNVQRYNGSGRISEDFGGDGGSASNHASLTNLAWLNSRHTGTDSRVAGFDSSGDAIEIDYTNWDTAYAHTLLTDNPHATTKAHVGLSDVPNTDFTVAVGLNTTHRGLTNNPHGVTLSDVGGTTDHTLLSHIGTKTHTEIAAHLANNSQAHSDYLINNGNDTTSGTITASGFTLTNTAGNRITSTAQSDYDKIRVWNNGSYTIGMKSYQSFGDLGDYAMTFTMNNDTNRGFLWRDGDDSASDGAMSLTTDGRLHVKTHVKTPILSSRSGTLYLQSAGTTKLQLTSTLNTHQQRVKFSSGTQSSAGNNGITADVEVGASDSLEITIEDGLIVDITVL